MIAVGHVQTHYVHSRSRHFFEHGVGGGRRTNGTDDFGFSHDSSTHGGVKARHLTTNKWPVVAYMVPLRVSLMVLKKRQLGVAGGAGIVLETHPYTQQANVETSAPLPGQRQQFCK